MLEGDFVGTNIATETKAQPQTDYNVYAFPEINDSGPMVMGGGDVMVMFKDNPAARALIEYLATPEAAEIWVEKGGFISANKNVPTSAYPDEVSARSAEILANAKTFRFDAGDLMPSALSAAFFDAVVAYVDDPANLDTILADLEATSVDARQQ